MNKRFSKFTGSFDEVQRDDLFFKNNAVLIQGIGLSPVIMAATTLKSACVLAVATLIMVMLTRVVCGGMHKTNTYYRMRPAVYAIASAAAYIPALMAVSRLFGPDIKYAGIYLPLLVVDGMVLARAESLTYERFGERLASGLMLSGGFAVVIVAVGALRELLGNGSIWGYNLFSARPLPIMGTVVGGFIVVALLAAALQAIINAYKRNLTRRTKYNAQQPY